MLSTLTTPTLHVEKLEQIFWNTLANYLDQIMIGAGILAGVMYILRMADRWFLVRQARNEMNRTFKETIARRESFRGTSNRDLRVISQDKYSEYSTSDRKAARAELKDRREEAGRKLSYKGNTGS